MTVRFCNQLVAELIQPFWAARRAGEFMNDALPSPAPRQTAVWCGFVRPVACARATQDGRSIASMADAQSGQELRRRTWISVVTQQSDKQKHASHLPRRHSH